ncbi:MAG TPA: phosphotransferase [Burkholderiaceae bacterium]|jgi:hypothetical protein
MSGAPVLGGAEAADPAWFTCALREAGALPEGQVIAVESERVGNGLIGDSVMFTLGYEGAGPGAPRSLVGKFASKDAPSKAAAIRLLLYKREVSFYREIAPIVQIRTPRTYFAGFDPQQEEFTVLMENLAPARGGEQIAGCSVADCAVALREIAALHAPRWGSPEIEATPWLRAREANLARHAEMLPGVADQFMERFGALVDDADRTLIERFVPCFGAISTDRSAPRTLVHADFRLDNVMFDVHGEPGTMATLDWQTICVDAGLLDVAFFIGGALGIDARRAHEEALVRGYLEALHERGVPDYGWDACWRDYRRFACRHLFTPLVSAVGFKRTPRGDEMFLTMLRRLCQQSVDLDSLAHWR